MENESKPDLNVIAPQPISEVPDKQANSEAAFFSRELSKAQIADIRQDTEERKRYSGKIFWLVTGWLASVLMIVVAEGFGVAIGFKLPNSVLLALVTTTTAGIVGTLTIVVRYLFTRRS